MERYINEIDRVTGVIDGWLQKHEFLVGDKCTYADLAFISWFKMTPFLTAGKDVTGKYKAYTAWYEKITSRPAVKKIFADQEKLSKGEALGLEVL